MEVPRPTARARPSASTVSTVVSELDHGLYGSVRYFSSAPRKSPIVGWVPRSSMSLNQEREPTAETSNLNLTSCRPSPFASKSVRTTSVFSPRIGLRSCPLTRRVILSPVTSEASNPSSDRTSTRTTFSITEMATGTTAPPELADAGPTSWTYSAICRSMGFPASKPTVRAVLPASPTSSNEGELFLPNSTSAGSIGVVSHPLRNGMTAVVASRDLLTRRNEKKFGIITVLFGGSTGMAEKRPL
jgi:hypothetical protein